MSTAPIRLICHRPGAPGLRLGLGPALRPVGALRQLGQLFNRETFWASDRRPHELRRMLRGSVAAVSAWEGDRLVAFGRATSDGVYRAVLWDVVVASDHKGQGLGRRLVERLLQEPPLACCERIYLMTTNSAGFYERLGFSPIPSQNLLVKRN